MFIHANATARVSNIAAVFVRAPELVEEGNRFKVLVQAIDEDGEIFDIDQYKFMNLEL
jgi:glutamine amidotransferase PdxT